MPSAGEKITVMNFIHKFFTDVLIWFPHLKILRWQCLNPNKMQQFENTNSSKLWCLAFCFSNFPGLKWLEGGKRTGRVEIPSTQKSPFYFLLLGSLFRNLAAFLECNYWTDSGKHFSSKDILRMTKLFQMHKGIWVFRTVTCDFYSAEY